MPPENAPAPAPAEKPLADRVPQPTPLEAPVPAREEPAPAPRDPSSDESFDVNLPARRDAPAGSTTYVTREGRAQMPSRSAYEGPRSVSADDRTPKAAGARESVLEAPRALLERMDKGVMGVAEARRLWAFWKVKDPTVAARIERHFGLDNLAA